VEASRGQYLPLLDFANDMPWGFRAARIVRRRGKAEKSVDWCRTPARVGKQ